MIITDEKLLRVECTDVLPNEIGELRDKLERELKRSAELGRPGIGLACPQIGIAKNMAIVRIPSTDNAYNIDLVNAKIEEGFDKCVFKDEGCLSFPDQYEDTMRYQEIKVVNKYIEPVSFVATGLFAVVIQHELDHLFGILLPDLSINKK